MTKKMRFLFCFSLLISFFLLACEGSTGGGNQSPTARFTATPTSGSAPLEVTFDATTSSDDGSIVSFDWAFGDGATDSGQTTSHRYTTVGDFTVTLTVTDDEGSSATVNQIITVLSECTLPQPGGLVAGQLMPSQAGSASIRGRVETDNALIPVSLSSAREMPADVLREHRVDYVPGQVLVLYQEDASAVQTAAVAAREQMSETLSARYPLQRLKMGMPQQHDLFEVAAGQDIEAVMAQLRADPSVRLVARNARLELAALPNDTRLQEQWMLPSSGTSAAWQLGAGSATVTVAVLDSGFDLDHPDLSFVAGYDFCADFNCTQTDTNAHFDVLSNVHGSHVAGIIGAVRNNTEGIAGAAFHTRLNLVPLKVFFVQDVNPRENTTVSALVDAMNYAAGISVTTQDNKVIQNPFPADILNMSLGGFVDAASAAILQAAVDAVNATGAVIYAATGNQGRTNIAWPAAADDVIGVASINQSFQQSCFSNSGGSELNIGTGVVDISAAGGEISFAGCSRPTESILSTVPDNQYGSLQGTSMATPLVSGIAALVKSHHPQCSNQEVADHLMATAFFDANFMNANAYGTGVVRADRALGLPGPGDQISISAQGQTQGDSDLDVVTLDLLGGSSDFVLSNLVADSYLIEASGNRFWQGQMTVNVFEGEQKTGIIIPLIP